MRLLFAVSLVLTGLASMSQQKADGLIWSSKPLTWDYFQTVEKIDGGKVLARTFCKFHMVIADTLSTRDSSLGIVVKVYALMMPSLSYVSEKNKNNSVLQHEQIHFDNVELAARKLRKVLSETNIFEKNYRQAITKLYRQHNAELKKNHSLYDETHRKVDKGHKWWREKLDQELESLKEFSKVELFIPLCVCVPTI